MEKNAVTYEIRELKPLEFQVRQAGSKYIVNLAERVFEFAIAVIELIKTIPYTKENEVIRYQLAKSGTSVGANYEEAQATSSRADFRHKISIVLREAKESNYWLRIMERIKIGNQLEVKRLIKESFELKNIFASMYNKVVD